MRGNRPRNTVLKADLSYASADGAISLPIFVYRKDSEITTAGVEFHQYHRGCGNRISLKRWCNTCDSEVMSGDFVKLTEVGEDKVMIEADEFKSLIYPNPSVEILHSVAVKDIPDLMQKNILAFHEMYEVRAFRAGSTKKEAMPTVERKLRAMFDALAKNKQALLVKAPIGGMERHGLLFANGDLVTLFYEEELREDIPMMYDKGEPDDVKMFSNFFKAKQATIDQPISCQPLRGRVEEVVNSKEPYIKANTEAKAAAALDATKDVMVQLKEYVESKKPV